jgi:ATP-dependent DNA helicase RecG
MPWEKLGTGRSEIIRVLSSEPLSKSEICTKLGLKGATGQLNREVRYLVDEEIISYTIPEKPNSRLQKYKLNKQKG